MKYPIRLGVTLSGGGARGIAHIGVIQALLEAELRPAVVSGTSAGAIAGVLWAAGLSPEDMLAFVKKTSFFKLFRARLPYSGLIPLTYLQERIREIVPGDRFEDLQWPVYVAASNLNTGACDLFSSGPLSEPVMASAAIPLLFQPVRIGGQLYVDGGVVNNLPVQAIAGKADFLLAVNVMPDVQLSPKELAHLFQIGTRTFELSVMTTSRPGAELADLVIEPPGMRDFGMFNLNKYADIHEVGYRAAREVLPELLERMEEKARQLNR